MSDSKVATTVSGGSIQGVAGAGSVVIENFTIYNRAAPESSPPQPSRGPIARCPYPGLACFGPQDADEFYGRDASIARLVEASGRQSLTAVVGASGSGKSSVVLAGVAPRLHKTGTWRFSHFRIGAELQHNPFMALARALVPLYVASDDETERLKNTKSLASNLQSGDLTLQDVLADCRSRNKSARILLIADQFEEALTLVEDQNLRHKFIDVLLAGFPDPGKTDSRDVWLILTLRGDFYGKALGYRPFADALQDHVENLGPMNREELQAAIMRPAERAGASFQAGLVETLLDDVENKPGSLPLLQFALRELWSGQEQATITRKSYDRIGGVQGALTQRAEKIFASLTGTDADVAVSFRRLFTRLATIREGQEHTRRVADRGELGEAVWSLAQRLADEDNRLVVTNSATATRDTVEVAHEALIRNWPRLKDWIDHDWAFQSWLQQINPSVELWSRTPTDESSLLRGSMLAQAKDWLATRRSDLSHTEQTFIEASLALHQRLSSERVVVEAFMRSLDVSDLSDQAKVDIARKKKLRHFVDLIPTRELSLSEALVKLYGESLGLDASVTLGALAEREASSRFEARLSEATVVEPLVPSIRSQGLALISSSSAREPAYAVAALGGSVFGHYFTEALAGRAADDRGIVTVRRAFEYVHASMRDAAVEFRQTPMLETHGDMADFAITGGPTQLVHGTGKRSALLAATDTFAESVPPLPGQEAQMRAVADLLGDSGAFDVTLILGDQLTRENLVQALTRLSATSGEDDCILFYFAGHGGFGTDHSFHVILADSLFDRPASVLEVGETGRILRQSRAGAAIVVLDTSFAGAVTTTFK